jgi:FkbM family methyltransferase
MFERIITMASGIFPAALWEKLEYASAFFAGKGSGSRSFTAEAKAASRFMQGDDLVLFDVGTNKGDWTEEMLHRAGPRVKAIYQFEPSPHNIQILKKKFSADPRITLMPFAVSDKKGEADLFSDVPGSGMASLYKRKLDHHNIFLKESSRIAAVTIDEIIAERSLAKIDFMKMDIEGHELAALKGAERSLKNGVIAALSFEFGGCNIDSRTYFQDFWYFLTGLGYAIFRITPHGGALRIARYRETLEYFLTTNYIAVRTAV